MPRNKTSKGPCRNCGNTDPRFGDKFCSMKCFGEDKHKQAVLLWKQGLIKGISEYGELYSTIRRYFIEKYGEQCQ
jgi:hypothetical protein